MNPKLLDTYLEKLIDRSIGHPEWIESKQVFEYKNQTVEVVVVLKLVRAAHGVKSMEVLCERGLFIDMGAIWRCVHDCCSEINFLLENYPKTSRHADQFVKAFFEGTIDGYWKSETNYISVKKIHSSIARILSLFGNESKIREATTKVYKALCGYIHAGYSHIMEVYGGPQTNLSFNLEGVPNMHQKNMKMEIVETAKNSVVLAMVTVAQKFDLRDLSREMIDDKDFFKKYEESEPK